MGKPTSRGRFREVGDGSGLAPEDTFYKEEVQLASRNRGMPLEGLRYEITPTGMHYLLVHYDIPEVAVDDWRLDVGGLVSEPLTLSLEEIKRKPEQTTVVTMECAGNGRALFGPRYISQPWMYEAVGTAKWTGTPLREILEDARVDDKAVEILFTGMDRGVQGDQVQSYQRSLSVQESMRSEILLAYQMNGEPLQPQHGYPLRLIVPGWYGMASVKWLNKIDALSEAFDGYQMIGTYRYKQSKDDLGDPVTQIKVRSLMLPPGIPDFLTRTRLLKAGLVTVTGRAWAGWLSVSKVEVSSDDGRTWSKALLGGEVSPYGWRPWSYEWNAAPGPHVLSVRATDSEGSVQPTTQTWNFEGMGNNMVQKVDVLVE